MAPPPEPQMPQPDVPPPPEEPIHARPGWRPVHPRGPTRRMRKPRPEATLAPEQMPMPEHRPTQSWATWLRELDDDNLTNGL